MKSYTIIDVYCSRKVTESDMDSVTKAVTTLLNGKPWFAHLLRPVGKYAREFLTQIKAHPFNFTTVDESDHLCIEIGHMHPKFISFYTKIVSI